MTNNTLHIVHIITGLNQGGAETVLLRLVSNLTDIRHTVISLSPISSSSLAAQFQAQKINVLSLEMNPKNFLSLFKIVKLTKILRHLKPSLIQTWMYHANLIGGIAARLAGIKFIIWNIRNGSLQKGDEIKTPLKLFNRTHFIVRLTAWLSRIIPFKIISCSKRAIVTHRFWGYHNNFHIIPNGVDENVFKPNLILRQKIRQEWKVEDHTHVIGLVGRFHSQKDIFTFLKAAHLLKNKYSKVQFLLCGKKQTQDNEQLMAWITTFHLSDSIILLGKREDIPAVLNGLDILCSASSYGEGFPNVLAEAMACGIPCVATDIGDSNLIVGDQGIIVQPQNPAEMANAYLEIFQNKENFRNIRERILQNFTLDKMVKNYKDFYNCVLKNNF